MDNIKQARTLGIGFILALLLVAGGISGGVISAQAAVETTSAEYGITVKKFKKFRYHKVGPMSWENLKGMTTFSNGTKKAEAPCIGGPGDSVWARGANGVQFAHTYFWPVSYGHNAFPKASYGARTFALSFKMEGTCGGPPWATHRSITGKIHF